MTKSLSRLQAFYTDLSARELLRVTLQEEFADQAAILTSFGADSALLLAMVAEIDPTAPVLFLQTEKHFAETLDYARQLQSLLGLSNVQWLKPDPTLLERLDPTGDLWNIQPNRCCWLRKVEPLDRAVEQGGYTALITGRKRFQTSAREQMESIELDEKGIFRINPLALWQRHEIDAEIAHRNLPPHPLVASGYKSIGCAPCTAPVAPGQDEREGRWAHTFDGDRKTECGLHVPAAATEWSV